jgi:hypothetical protein
MRERRVRIVMFMRIVMFVRIVMAVRIVLIVLLHGVVDAVRCRCARLIVGARAEGRKYRFADHCWNTKLYRGRSTASAEVDARSTTTVKCASTRP